MKLMKLLDEYVNHLKSSSNKSKETISTYKYDVSLFVSHLKNNLLSKMTVASYFQSLIKDGYKASSIKRKRISISLFLDYLKVNKKIKVNYTKEIVLNIKDEKSIPKTIPISIIKKMVFHLYNQRSECASKYDYFKSNRDLALFDLLITTGIRINEASTIKINDIDFASRIILIHGKGKKERIAYIPNNDCWSNLQRYWRIRKNVECQNDYLFLNKYKEKLGTHCMPKRYPS